MRLGDIQLRLWIVGAFYCGLSLWWLLTGSRWPVMLLFLPLFVKVYKD